ncbi:MAG: cellulase family glycosylhydrolase [Thermodesulfobacteriota bacterium]
MTALHERWPVERVAEWYAREPWLVGFNYLPRSAVNWTELWQAGTFDLATIEQELGWAQAIGFNALRTNLQYLVWRDDPAGLRDRVDRFLGVALRHGIRVMLCPFDDCGFSGREPYLGEQDDPVPGVHNSGAAASPGRAVVRDRARWADLERYVRDVVGHFRDDRRVVAWDLYNEPGNDMAFAREPARDASAPGDPLWRHSMALARECFAWARAAAPSQPLTSGVWSLAWQTREAALLELSDFVSFHDYLPLGHVEEMVATLRREGRPIVCTEWLARGLDSRVATHLPWFAAQRIGCFHWGLVNGRTQTHLPWPGFESLYADGTWHHDLLHADGAPYDAEEIALFRRWCATARDG